MRILAISGSLRAKSTNTTLLRAIALLAPVGVEVAVYERLGDLPMFNPDIEATNPRPVANFRTQVVNADAVIIASPEYAHGITGVLKNALDWMVGYGAFINKPVAVLNASPRAVHAQASLKETLLMMSALIIEKASIEIELIGSQLNEADILANLHFAALLRTVINELGAQISP